MFHAGFKFGIFPGKIAVGTVASLFCTSPQGHEQGVSGKVQQHVSSTDTEFGRNCERFFLQQHPSHKQIPSGATILQNMATITTQAIHCRNKNDLMVLSIISTIWCKVNSSCSKIQWNCKIIFRIFSTNLCDTRLEIRRFTHGGLLCNTLLLIWPKFSVKCNDLRSKTASISSVWHSCSFVEAGQGVRRCMRW